MLHLVRHGRPLVDPGVAPARWELDPSGFDDVWALRDRLPVGALWCSSPEPKALATAQLLTDTEVAIVPALREQERPGWVEDLPGLLARAVAAPDVPAHEGWEPLSRCRDRVLAAVRGLLVAEPAGRDLVLVGHGTAWSVVAAASHGAPVDLPAWARLAMPDVITLDDAACDTLRGGAQGPGSGGPDALGFGP